MADLAGLLDRLRHGERPALARDEVDALVTWLCGAADRDRDDAEKILPSPGHDPVLLQMVFYRLDATLFNGSELNLAVAGLDAGQPEKAAQGALPSPGRGISSGSLSRTGRLAHGALADRAASLRPVQAPAQRDAGDRSGTGIDRCATGAFRHAPRGRPRASKKRLRGFMLRLRQRFGHDRYLAHKLVGGLAVIALLPVLNLLLAPGKGTVDYVLPGENPGAGGLMWERYPTATCRRRRRFPQENLPLGPNCRGRIPLPQRAPAPSKLQL